jgi:hypothetical protein
MEQAPGIPSTSSSGKGHQLCGQDEHLKTPDSSMSTLLRKCAAILTPACLCALSSSRFQMLSNPTVSQRRSCPCTLNSMKLPPLVFGMRVEARVFRHGRSNKSRPMTSCARAPSRMCAQPRRAPGHEGMRKLNLSHMVATRAENPTRCDLLPRNQCPLV